MKKFYSMMKYKNKGQQLDPHQSNQIDIQATWQEVQETLLRQQEEQKNQLNQVDGENEEYTQQTQQTTMTTANGDGIEFNPILGSIFDEIERIKSQSSNSLLGHRSDVRIREEDELRMEDIPQNLRLSSLILESARTLENFKQYVIDTNKKEDELLSLIKGIKFDKPVRSVSTSLNLLILKYKDSLDRQDSLQDRIDQLQSDKQDLLHELMDSKLESEKHRNQIEELKAEVAYYQDEHKRLNLMFEKCKRQIEENDYMKQSENMKLLFDSQIYKERVEKLKFEIHELKKQLKEQEKYQGLYQELQQKFNESESKIIQEKIQKQKQIQQLNQSFFGHIKGKKSVFTQETCLFLEVNDILKITLLSKKTQGIFLKSNSQMILSQLNVRFYELKMLNDELQKRIGLQDKIIKRNEEKDNIRQMILQDGGDEKMRYILEKHVVRRAIEQKVKGNMDYKNELIKESEKTINTVTHFIGSYFELINLYHQKLREQEQQLAQQQLLKESQIEQQPIVDKRLLNTGKKLVSSFGFGFLKRKQKQPDQPPQILEQPHITAQPVLQEQEVTQNSFTASDEKPNIIIEESEEKNEQNESQNTTGITNEEEHKKEMASIIEEEVKEDYIEEPKVQVNVQQKSNLIGLTKPKADNAAELEPVKVLENTFNDIKNSNSIDEMNQVLYRIGSFLLNDKKRLSSWIAGIQQGFVELYILMKNVYLDFQELELLKDFLVQRVESLKLKVYELLNEKEDMIAIHQSDTNVKEYLKFKLNEAEKINMEKGSELIMERSRIEDLIFSKEESERKMKLMESEVVEYRSKSQKEIKRLKEKAKRLSEENKAYINAIEDMRRFFNKVSNN